MAIGVELAVGIYLGFGIGLVFGFLLFRPGVLASIKARLTKSTLVDCWIVTKTGRLLQKRLPVFIMGDQALVRDGESYRFVRSDALLRPQTSAVPVHIYPEADAVPWFVDELSSRVQVIFRDMEVVRDNNGKPVVDSKTKAPKLHRIKVLARMMNPVKFERREVYSAIHSKWSDELLTAMADKMLRSIMIFSVGAFGVALATIVVLFARFGPQIAQILKLLQEIVSPTALVLLGG